MKKIVLVGAALAFTMLFAAEAPEEEALQEEASSCFVAGFDVDLFSAYMFRNAIINDEIVVQPCVWADITLFDVLTIGGTVWQSWNLQNGQRADGVPNEMNESDYNVHIGWTAWTSEDEAYALYLQVGHDWFTYRYDCDSENELSLRLEFSNPFVGLYGQYSQAYYKTSCCHFEVGLVQEWSVAELFEDESDFLKRLTIGFDWNVNFASGRFFTNYLYGPVAGAYDAETGEFGEALMSDGIGGTTIRVNLAYEVCEHFSVGAVLAFTSTLSSGARDAVSFAGHDESYKDLAWGGLQAKLSF